MIYLLFKLKRKKHIYKSSSTDGSDDTHYLMEVSWVLLKIGTCLGWLVKRQVRGSTPVDVYKYIKSIKMASGFDDSHDAAIGPFEGVDIYIHPECMSLIQGSQPRTDTNKD